MSAQQCPSRQQRPTHVRGYEGVGCGGSGFGIGGFGPGASPSFSRAHAMRSASLGISKTPLPSSLPLESQSYRRTGPAHDMVTFPGSSGRAKYWLSCISTPHCDGGRARVPLRVFTLDLPGQSQPDVVPTFFESARMHLFENHLLPWPGKNDCVLMQFWPSLPSTKTMLS